MFVTVKVRVITDETGAFTEVPGLLTPAGILNPLLDYCLARSHDRSLEWMEKVRRSTQLFLEYLQSNPEQRDTHQLFRNFAQRLYTGTFDIRTGLDPSGLCWRPRTSSEARHIITDLSFFFDWLSVERPATATINPKYAGDGYDRACDEAAFQYRRDRALLGHTWKSSSAETVSGRRIRPQSTPTVTSSEPPAFPDDRFMDLLTKGFKVGEHFDYRGILITLLCHGAGFRESEPFHLYIEDVMPDPANPKIAKVRIHHPSEGLAPPGWTDDRGRKRKGNRAAYLAEKYGLVPRTMLLDSRAAGWKGGALDGAYYKEAYWFHPELGELFLQVWQRYLHEVAMVERGHPFAFINLSREPKGEMYTLAQYNKAHARACRRIGLEVKKALGTTPHGHRHAYGRRLRNSEVAPLFIKRFMHHSAIESQQVYTQATSAEVTKALMAAAEKLKARAAASGGLPLAQLGLSEHSND